MVKEFAVEKRFTLSLPTRAHLELFAESFSKNYGCRVVWNREANKIAVRCPEPAVVAIDAAS